jgi:hypothetical protein
MRIDTKLEKNTYDAGETVKGKLLIMTNKVLKVRKFNFSVRGKERYEEHGHSGSATYSDGMFAQWKEKHDLFFFEDLSGFLNSIDASARNNGDLQIPEGEFAIPFHFSIPSNALESYHGRDVRIEYEVRIDADMGRWKKDYHHVTPFKVMNSKMTYTFGGDRLLLGEQQQGKEGKPHLDLKLENSDSIDDIPVFSPGQMVRGESKIENIDMRRTREVIIQLYGVEFPKWGRGRQTSEVVKKEISLVGYKPNNIMISFEMEIPHNAKRSYSGRFSEYYWILETKVDISGKSDIHANRILCVT